MRDQDRLSATLTTGATAMNWTTDPPTQPGAYWFQPETVGRALLVEVRLTEGQLTVWWPKTHQPVGNVNGRWRGPIPPSTGPGSRQMRTDNES